jgi:WD40 repeat protein
MLQVNSVASLEFSDDGRWLVSRTRDHQMQLWAVENDSRLRSQETFSDTGLPLQSVKFEPTRVTGRQTRWLLGEVGDGTVLLWDLNAPRNLPRALRGHKGPLTVTSFDPRGKWLLTSCFDGTSRLWDMERLADAKRPVEPRVILHDAHVLTGGFSTAQNRIATFTNRGELRSLDLDQLKDQAIVLPESLPLMNSFLRSRVAFSGDGDSLLLIAARNGGRPPLSKVWRPGDLQAGDRPNLLDTMFPNSIVSPEEIFLLSRYVLSPDRRFLAGLDMSGNIVVVDPLAPNEAEALRIQISQTLNLGNAALGFSTDAKHLVVAQQDIGVKLWDLQSGPARAVPSGEASFPWQKSQDPVPFPGASEGETPRINENSDTTAVACTNDGTLLAAASRGVIWVWERKNDQSFTPLIALRGHSGIVPVLVFTPDGQSLVSGSNDSTVRVWHLKPTPKLDAFVPLLGHKGPITSASISPDGRSLLTTSLDGTARVWTLDRETLLRLAGEMTREPEDSRVKRSSRY